MNEKSLKPISKPKKLSTTPHAHDRTLKAGMKDLRVAKDVLRHHLPVEIKEMIHIETLELEDGSFVDPELKALHTDILYSVDLINTAVNKKAYIYIHLEHQSTTDPLISFRMLKYCVRIIDRYIKNSSDHSHTLPVIIPLVLYNGEKRFSDSVSVFNLFGEHKNMAKKYMFDSFHLIDMNTISDEEIRQREWSCLMESIFKHIHARDIMVFLEEITPLFHRILIQSNTADHVMAMVKYLLEKAQIRDRQQFLIWIKKNLPPQLEKQAMTLAEQWKLEGKLEGRLEGKLEGERSLLKRILIKRFGPIPSAFLKKIEEADVQSLLELGDKAIEAKNIEDIFETYH